MIQRANRSTFELWSMAQIRQVITDRVARLFAPPKWRCKCYRCHAAKAPIEWLIGDATRLYTSVSTEQVIEAAQEFKELFEKYTREDKVSVLHTRRVKGYAGGATHNTKTGTTFTTAELMDMVKFATLCRVFRVGDAIVRQVLGVPMGGHMSKIFISILLCKMEGDLFDDRRWLIDNDFFSEVMRDAGLHPTELVNGIRWVDDVLIFSRIFCQDCLVLLLKRMYKAPLEFEIEGRPPVGEFLDLLIRTRGDKLGFSLRQKNEKWAYGESDTIAKTSLPPVLGRPVISRKRVSVYLSSKLHRVDQVHPQGTLQRTHALVDILTEVHKLGYPSPFVRRALDGIRHIRVRDLAALGQAVIEFLDHPPAGIQHHHAKPPTPPRAADNPNLVDTP
jgi:hypothetical protein